MNPKPTSPIDRAMHNLLESATGVTVSEEASGEGIITDIDAFDDHIEILEQGFEQGFARLQAKMLCHIARIKSKRNALLGVARLPVELFVEFCTHFLNDETTSLTYAQKTLTLMLVCKQWHDVVDNAPTLWSHLSPLSPLKYNSMVIVKSKSSNLTINQPRNCNLGNTESYVSYIAQIFPEVPRWASATISPRRLDAHGLRLLQQHAPRLTSFSMNISSWMANELPPEPLDLFGENAPQLRGLELVQVPIPWTSSILFGLTTLTLTFPKHRGPSSLEVLQVLEKCPDLTTLSLTGMDLRATDQVVTEVELPKLAQLTLEKLSTNITRSILMSISAPICKKLTLECLFAKRSAPIPLLTADHFIRSFPTLHQLLQESQTVVIDNPTRTWIGLSVDFEGKECLQLFFNNYGLSSLLEWLEQVTPGLKDKAAEVNFELEWANVGDWEVLAALDERLGVVELSTSWHEGDERDSDDGSETGGAERLLEYLATPNIKDGILQWPFPNLRNLSIMPEKVPPFSIFNMVESRYGGPTSSTAQDIAQKLPEPFDKVHVCGARLTAGTRREITELVGKKVIIWG